MEYKKWGVGVQTLNFLYLTKGKNTVGRVKLKKTLENGLECCLTPVRLIPVRLILKDYRELLITAPNVSPNDRSYFA